jgi:hypothetical protein
MASHKSPKQKYPFASLAYYGPDSTRATKLVAAVFTRPGRRDAAEMERWSVESGDVRNDPVVAAHLMSFLASFGVKNTVSHDRIIGCPHEEGIDYPMGRTCPRCPFWANIDRFTHEPIVETEATMSPADVLKALSERGSTPPSDALRSADALRAALVDPLLQAIERGLADPAGASEEDTLLFTHALYLLAHWREVRAYPLVVRWLSLPLDGAEVLAGDVVTQDGDRILAAVCDGNLEPIKTVILDREADQFCRAAAIGALARLAAWAELPRPAIVEQFLWLAREGLEREPGYVWVALATGAADIEALEVFPEVRRAADEGLIDPQAFEIDDLDAVEAAPRGDVLRDTRESYPPVDDVAEATEWWSDYAGAAVERVISDGTEPYRAPPKIGRNDPCPCGSGKKYKKCCGG